MELEQLADELAVPVSEVKRFLRTHFPDETKRLSNAGVALSREQVTAARDAHRRGELVRARRDADVEPDETPADPKVSCEDLLELPSVRPELNPPVARDRGRHAIYFHQDLLEWLEDPRTPVELRKVATRRVQELMAYGHATRMKGVRGKNAGWLRTPLGGNGGNQYYLWFLNTGEPVRAHREESLALFAGSNRGARFLRVARHHDETVDPLDVGVFDDYVQLNAQNVFTASSGFSTPLVAVQRAIVEDTNRVRVLEGRPGAGKTTSLLEAATRLSGRALYVTWSAELADRSRGWLDAHAPEGLAFEVWTFRELVQRIDPARPLPEGAPLSSAIQELTDHAGDLLHRGAWRHRDQVRAEALYAELHAHLLGAALPVAFEGRRACSLPRLDEADYLALRGSLGVPAARDAMRVYDKLDDDARRRSFSTTYAAFDRALALQREEIVLDPEVFAFDWVLVDEVQDLTRIEQWLLIDVVARSGRIRGVKPGLIVAGDEAQTVRPTAFEFASLSRLVAERLDAHTERATYKLDENLRSPETIARLVENVEQVLYGGLPKGARPRGSRTSSPADVTTGRVLQVDTSKADALREVLTIFKLLAGDAALVVPTALVPDHLKRLADEVGITVWTSESIKGLEFRTVGVLDVPRSIADIDVLLADTKAQALSVEIARTTIDRFLVALSRATETVVLIGAGWSERTNRLDELFAGAESSRGTSGEDGAAREGHLGFVDPTQLQVLLDLDAADAVARIGALIQSSEQLVAQGEHAAAIREAENARGLLGQSNRPGAAGKELRRRTFLQLARANALAALSESTAIDGRGSLLAVGARAYTDAGENDVGSIVTALKRVLSGPAESGRDLLDVAHALVGLRERERRLSDAAWLALRRRIEADVAHRHVPKQQSARSDYLAALEIFANQAPSDREAFGRLEQRAREHFLRDLAARNDERANAEFSRLRPALVDETVGAELDALHAESRGEWDRARACWDFANKPEEALRCARSGGDLRAAADLASRTRSPDAALLDWGRDLIDLLDARPAPGQLEPAELEMIRRRISLALGVGNDAPQPQRKERRRRS